MLQLVFGRAGSGKTEYVRRLAAESAGSRPTVLLVPEQASFENERAMLRLLGPKDAQKVQVLSFSRLADQCFRQYGGAAGRRLEDGGRAIFMNLAISDTRDELEFYGKSAEKGQLGTLMLSAMGELKMCGITPEDLRRTSESGAGLGGLGGKLRELSLVFSAYDALVAQSYIDPLDDLTRLKGLLDEHAFFEGASVFLDSFQAFTVQEYEVLRRVFSQAEQVTVTLCADGLNDPERGVGLFSLVRRTGSRLAAMANECGERVAVPVILAQGRRFEVPALSALEENIFRAAKTPFLQENTEENAVSVYMAQDMYDEAEYVSARIRELVMREGFRYRDFTVITRTPDSYAGILDSALERRGIPCFMDKPAAVQHEPLMRLVLEAFRVLKTSFRTDEVFAYLKTGLAGLLPAEISALENYAFTWDISGKKWCSPWMEHPRGFAESMTAGDVQALQNINTYRGRAVGPILAFADALENADGEAMAAAVYSLLERTEAAKALRMLAQKLEAGGRPELAQRQLRLWEVLMEALDQIALVLRGRFLKRDDFAELLELVIRARDILSIPQVLDEVTVGAADRMRPNKPRVVFLLGAAQGEFPLTPGTDCVFSPSERRTLIELGLPLNETLEGTAVQERFLAYTAMCGASQRLYISCPLAGQGGDIKTPSTIVEETLAVLPATKVLRRALLPREFFINAAAPAFEAAARAWNEKTVFSASLKALFEARPAYAPRLQAVERAANGTPMRFANVESAAKLFGGRLRLSATQIETYHLCRFQYFCRFGLNAKERRAARIDAMEYGSLMHYLLEHLFKDTGAERLNAMSAEELKSECARLLHEYVEFKLGGLAEKSPRFVHLFERLAENAAVIAAHIAKELCQSGFSPEAFELEIGKDAPALVLPMPDGEVLIEGKVDRVDLFDGGGVPYIRVVDYKTGKKEFKLTDLIYGMNMQMLIYLAALCEGGRFAGSKPAGVLYMPAARPVISAARGTSAEKIYAEEEKKLRMNGLLSDNPETLQAMEPAGEGKYIPVAMKDGAPAKRDSVLTEHELRAVMTRIKGLVTAMAESLRAGRVEALPLSGDYDACEWCPYVPVCGHEKGGPSRRTEKWSRDEAIKQLTENAEWGGSL